MPDLHAVADRIESLLDELRSATEGRVWLRVEELVRLLTDLYGAGLARTLELADDHPDLITRLGRDELVGSLLVLHDLHPGLARATGGPGHRISGTFADQGRSQHRGDRADSEAAAVSVTVTAPGSGCGSTGEVLCGHGAPGAR